MLTCEGVAPALEPAAVAAFWREFAAREQVLSAQSGQDFVEAVNTLLSACTEDLALELEGEDSPRRLVITAHGRVEQFANVQALAAAAPPLAHHEVGAFRTRGSGEFAMRMNDFELPTSDVIVGHYNARGLVGLELRFARDVPMDLVEHARHMAFIMLDHVLGEYDFAVRVGPVDFVESFSDEVEGEQPLAAFAPVFDRFWRDTLGRNDRFPGDEGPWAMLEVDEGDDHPAMMMMLNRGADALTTRADLPWALEVTLPVEDRASLDRVQDAQDAIARALEAGQDGVLALSRMASGQRTALYYVGSAATAAERARAACQQAGLPAPGLACAFDPSWHSYLDFYTGPCQSSD